MFFKHKSILRKRFVFPAAVILTVLISLGVFIFTEDRLQFKRISEELFQSEFEDNTLNLHYTLAYPENYGFASGAALPCYTGKDNVSPSEGGENSDKEAILDLLDSLSHISKERLSETDSYTYDLLIRYLDRKLSGTEFDYYSEPFSPGSGIQSTLPILLADYAFRRKQDVEDYLMLLDQTDDYLSGLLLYETEKAEAGLFMADYSASKVIAQCTSIMDKKQLENGTHFLHTTFEERLGVLIDDGVISQQEADQYLAENDRLLTTVMEPAYTQIADTFTLLMGNGTNDFGLYYFPEGRQYYEYLLSSVTGSDRPVSEIKRLLFEDFQKNYNDMLILLAKYPEISDAGLIPSFDLPLNDPARMLKDLQSHMAEDFPSFPSDNEAFKTVITVKSVSSAMEDYSSPAYYLTPPIDDMERNVIYINGKNTPDNLTLYTTLAHEGYPGHLYQTVYSQLYLNQNNASHIRYLLHYGGFVEGWAYYVEDLSYSYAKDHVKNNAYASAYYEACRLNRNIHLCLYSLIDIAIHYDGADPQQIQKILRSVGIVSPASAAAIYQYIAEEPVNYLKYYLGYIEIELLKEKAKILWGNEFTLYRFHKFLLETGPSDFAGINEQILKTAN